MKRAVWLGIVLALIIGILPVRGQAVELKIPGKSALLMDAATGTVLYEFNAHEKLAPASVTKVMTLLLIMEAIDSGNISWDDTVTASETAAAKGGSQVYLKAGETMPVKDMVKSIAVSSANDCACAMAEHLAGSEAAFAELMNRRANELGMEDTHFVNCTGLDDDADAKNHLTSAHDIAVMSRQLLKYHENIKKFTTIWMDTIRNGTFGLSNTNKMVRFYNGCTGLKTGFTSGAGFCLSASAKRENMELIAVVMGCTTSQERFSACKSMLDFGFANYALVTPDVPENQTVPVKLGVGKEAIPVPAELPELLVEKALRNQITSEITLKPEMTAPVSKGCRLGEMTVRAGEQILAKVPLVAETEIPRLSYGDLFVKILKKISMAKEVQ